MLTSIVVSIVKACTRFAVPTVLIALILAIASGFYTARNFAINTDISNLISANIDWRQREIALEKAFPSRVHTILAVVDAPTPELATLAADSLAARLKQNAAMFPEVRRPERDGPFCQRSGSCRPAGNPKFHIPVGCRQGSEHQPETTHAAC